MGTLAHRFLEDWDFGRDPASFRDDLKSLLDRDLQESPDLKPEFIRQDLESIFETFFASEAYQELAGSRILGREVPFLLSKNGQIMEGIIDLIYEKEGKIFVADYKTDRIKEGDLANAGKPYRHQAEIYSEAVRRSLQKDIGGFKLIFLRIGKALQV